MYLSINKLKIQLSVVILLISASGFSVFAQINSSDWHTTTKSPTITNPYLTYPPVKYKMVSIDGEHFYNTLRKEDGSIWLPNPEGEMAQFILKRTNIISEDVAHHYNIQTFHGYMANDPSVHIACDISSAGFHASVLTAYDSYYIEPASKNHNDIHLVYYKRDKSNVAIEHSVENKVNKIAQQHINRSLAPDQKITFRLALSTTGEFSQQFGGTPYNPTNVMNALASGVNMINLIYLRDLGIEFTLITSPILIFEDPNNDPYSNISPTQLLQEANETIFSVLDANDFDVGHLLSWDNLGGAGTQAVVCSPFQKAQGFSSTIVSINTLWIDFVCHNLGHQFGADNNSAAGECQDSVDGFRYEPGAGSTIMSSLATCSQLSYTIEADPFFHYASIEAIQANIDSISCGVITATNNIDDPIVDANANITIPKETPFILVGRANDINDPSLLTYDWEQFDGDGPATSGLPDCNDPTQPLFRYRPPSTDNFRYFPEYNEILMGNNIGTDFEKLPCTQREMLFSLAVRDNDLGHGRVVHDTMRVFVADTGPFEVTAPNGGETYIVGTNATITWNENNTSLHCPLIDILISTDSGVSYSVLEDSISNNGSITIPVPDMVTTQARILLRCHQGGGGFQSSSTFFDISNNDFQIDTIVIIDDDGDGWDVTEDCDDNDPNVNPGADEICNGIDDNCNLLIDDADPTLVNADTWYLDNDGDGFGDASMSMMACIQPIGYVADNTDCDDTNRDVFPGADEVCNGIDDDCDGLVDTDDPDLVMALRWYFDNDGDGFGDATMALADCNQPTGYVDNPDDCDDTDADINPNADEVCNGIDDNCNGLIDADDPSLVGNNLWFRDMDNDQFGDDLITLISCSQPPGYVSMGGDCNDNNQFINPLAQEICNGIDDDCDGLVDSNDPDVTGTLSWFRDFDGDGFGNAAIVIQSCNAPAGFVSNSTDCNDNNSFINPNAPEICNGIDDDCDGLVDTNDPDLTGVLLWYGDFDGDGFGNIGNAVVSCTRPSGFVSNSLDCNDNDPDINPNAVESCNGIDDDCDNLVDDNDPSVVNAATFYIDNDQDGFGDANDIGILSCAPPPGHVPNNLDCNDENSSINPAGQEVCNGLDDDCDGLIDQADPSITGLVVWFADLDGDGFGNPNNSVQACIQPANFVSNNNDCDDGNNTISPSSPELCNGIDDDCDGLIDGDDPDLTSATIWYFDGDMDGFGNPSNSVMACSQPIGFVGNNLDCDDSRSTVNPNSPEVCGGLDDNCNGLIDEEDPSLTGTLVWYADNDGDGFGDNQNTVLSCTQPLGFVDNNIDCNDMNPLVNPMGQEVCNGFDDDCDGLIDSADPDNQGNGIWYVDADRDGFGNTDIFEISCVQPTGFVSINGDCNDNNPNINPGATETCNSIDDDCDGFVDGNDPNLVGGAVWYQDADNDGWGDAAVSRMDCSQPFGFVANAGDCNDSNASIFPGSTEVCNGLDDDCDGLVDGDDPDFSGAATWYLDADGDGFGNAANSVQECVRPAGYVDNGNDCNDGNPQINPAATETCNGVDDDCDNLTDGDDPDVSGLFRTWYADLDRDGFGNENQFMESCTQPAGFVSNSTDCDDTNEMVFPGAIELCNGIDDDCDGLLDDQDPDVVGGNVRWFRDNDSDGFGDANMSLESCTQPAGYVMDDSDCDDNNPSVFPSAQEVCNGRDDNCDGLIDIDDPNISGVGLWFADLDEDGFGDPNNTVEDCTQPIGFTFNNEDCDDTNPFINPEAQEICNEIDDNCDGLIDDEDTALIDGDTFFFDADGDGYGDDLFPLVSCDPPSEFVLLGGDCDDTNPDIFPGAEEILGNGVDEDCDGLDNTTSTTELNDDSLVTFPNPFTEWFTIDSEKQEIVNLKLLDINGRIINSLQEVTLPYTHSFSDLTTGTYLLVIQNQEGGKQTMRKIIKI